ncbi:MAG TPA: type II toxin-antitoxin system prevent-host-death family antitoxin [Pseudomonadaceae bacterium]|nr:type II toxin-antitoxin system prevent-host-death family antitoxin [Pseudomonadaceae bacterium]
MTMNAAELQQLEALPRSPASDVKKLGWRGVLEIAQRSGHLVITNHDRPEAVIVPAAEYARLLQRVQELDANKQAAIAQLNKEWDERLAVLRTPEAREKMREILRKPLHLHGQVLAGEH